jgi:hypothetical protein
VNRAKVELGLVYDFLGNHSLFKDGAEPEHEALERQLNGVTPELSQNF